MPVYRFAVPALLLTLTPVAIAQDLIDARQLGMRGVALESSLSAKNSFIWDVQGLGDFDGDGLDDIGVSYQSEPNDLEYPVRVSVLYGRRDLWGRYLLDDLPRKTVFRSKYSPNHIHAVGDVNGDGFADFMVGFVQYQAPKSPENPGTAFLVYGHSDLKGEGFFEEIGDGVPGVVFWSSDPTHQALGINYANIGDINGDGREDLAIGASYSLVFGVNAGVLFVLLDTRNLPARVDLADVGTKIPGFVVRGTVFVESPDAVIQRPAGALGDGIARAGDFDGDGIADFLVSAREIFTVYLLRGRTAWPPVIDIDGVDASGLARLGITPFRGPFDNRICAQDHQFAGIGDIDGDGRGEILVGTSRQDPQFGQGLLVDSELFLFRGRTDLPGLIDLANVPPELATVFRPFKFGDKFAQSVAPAGDLDGDGVPDFLVGAPYAWRDGITNVGEVYAIFSRRSFPNDVHLDRGFDGIRMLGEGFAQHFGYGVASAGDFNGDGALDIVVSASHFSPISADRGRVYIIYGNGSNRPPLTLLSLTPDFGTVRGGTPVVVRGSGFVGSISVSFGDRSSPTVEVISSSEIHVVTPPGAALGMVDLTVSTAGESRTFPTGFEYAEPLPAIDVGASGRRGFTILGDGVRRVGESMAIGDITGDGIAELIVSHEDNEPHVPWQVDVIRGGPRREGVVDLSESPPGVTNIDASVLGNGGLVAVVGDVNGDGIFDLGLGANHALGAILFGRRDLPPTVDLAVELQSGGAVSLVVPGSTGEFSFAPAGDINGDSVADLAIGHPDLGLPGGVPQGGSGQVILLSGRRSWPAVVDLGRNDGVLGRFLGGPKQELGFRLTAAGDVNGDGRLDFLSSTASPTRAYLLYGPAPPFGDVSAADYVAAGGGVAFDIAGTLNPKGDRPWVAAAGDVDGDGFADVLLGLWEAGRDFEGRTYLVRGSRSLPSSVKLPGFAESIEFIGPGSEAQSGPVGPAGDFNADGLADFLIASPGPVDPPGAVYIILGARNLPPQLELAKVRGRGLRIDGVVPFGGTQVPLREAGDLDGDGASDIAFSERGIGSPEDILGRVHVVFGLPQDAAFIRGDANYDEQVNLSDAVFILGHLFLGRASPACEDAADTDDSGKINITDAIGLLEHLFRGGPPPPPPYPASGLDPSADTFHCRGF